MGPGGVAFSTLPNGHDCKSVQKIPQPWAEFLAEGDTYSPLCTYRQRVFFVQKTRGLKNTKTHLGGAWDKRLFGEFFL